MNILARLVSTAADTKQPQKINNSPFELKYINFISAMAEGFFYLKMLVCSVLVKQILSPVHVKIFFFHKG